MVHTRGEAESIEPERMIAFLESAASFPHRPHSVRLIQTHISYVAIAGDEVYKVKKPVDFGFVDFTTLEKRRHFAHREVELNRRLCPEVYLGVVAIIEDGGSLRFVEEADAAGQVVDYAVRMKRLDERRFLETRLAEGKVTVADVGRIVATLADFYRGSVQLDRDAEVEVAQVRRFVYDNLDAMAPFAGDILPAETLRALRFYNDRFFARNTPALRDRAANGWVRDGHGDLRPAHIHLGPESVCIFDCVEFNDAFRQMDVAADAAFLAMELEYCGRADLSHRFVSRLAEGLGDPGMRGLMPFYKGYRAAVRGKVGALAATEPEMSEEARCQSRERAGGYFRLALSYVVRRSAPLVLALMGKVGAGKSTLAAVLGESLGWAVYGSDRIRKTLAGLPLHERTPVAERKRLYSTAMTRRTYAELIARAEGELAGGRSVIVDATFGHPRYRDQLRSITSERPGDVVFVEVDCPDDVIQERLARREEEPNVVSDARLEDFQPLSGAYQAPDQLPRDHHVKVDGTKALGGMLDDVYRRLIERAFAERNEPGGGGEHSGR